MKYMNTDKYTNGMEISFLKLCLSHRGSFPGILEYSFYGWTGHRSVEAELKGSAGKEDWEKDVMKEYLRVQYHPLHETRDAQGWVYFYQ